MSSPIWQRPFRFSRAAAASLMPYPRDELAGFWRAASAKPDCTRLAVAGRHSHIASMAQYRITYARPGWQKFVGLVVIGALVAAAVVLLLGLAILLVPVVAVAVLIARWR